MLFEDVRLDEIVDIHFATICLAAEHAGTPAVVAEGARASASATQARWA